MSRGDPLLARFADALEYPGADLLARLDACHAAARTECPDAAPLVAGFRDFAAGTDAGHLEELYAAVFDLDAGCAPWIGAHLFKDDRRRGEFLARLAAAYRARGFSAGTELPDHLCVVLRYLAVHGGDEEGEDLLALAALPAVAAIATGLQRRAHPWEPLVKALLAAMRARAPEAGVR